MGGQRRTHTRYALSSFFDMDEMALGVLAVWSTTSILVDIGSEADMDAVSC